MLALTSNASNYSGGTTLQAGILQSGSNAALGTGALTVNGGVLDLNGYSISVGSLSGNGGLITRQQHRLGHQYAQRRPDLRRYVRRRDRGRAATRLLALSKSGTSTLTLSGDNAYTGGTSVGTAGAVLAVGLERHHPVGPPTAASNRELPGGQPVPGFRHRGEQRVLSAALSTADWGLGPHNFVATLTGGNPSSITVNNVYRSAAPERSGQLRPGST